MSQLGCDLVFQLREVPRNRKNSQVCTCQCNEPPIDLPPTRIATGNDDVQQTGTTMTFSAGILNLGATGGNQPTIVGFRFPTLGITRNAQIFSAEIQLTSSQPSTTPTSTLNIYAEDADDAAPFTTGDLASRARTAAVVWNITAPWALSEAGPNQKTPNLASIIQAVVNRPGWNPQNALAILIDGTGGRTAASIDSGQSRAAVLTVHYAEPRNTQDIPVCMPDELNPNIGHPNEGIEPTAEQLEADCTGRVQTTVTGLARGCGYSQECVCHLKADSVEFADACEPGCTANDLATDCTNLDPTNHMTATNAPGDPPVCTTNSPIAVALFGRRSRCEVSGTAHLEADGESKNTATTGVVDFIGTPCPGQSCQVGVSHRFRMNNITFSNFFGSATFSQLAALGATLEGSNAQVAATGDGVIPINATASSARGRRDNGDVKAFAVSNQDVINIGVNWTPGAASCSMSGAVVGTVNPEQQRCENAPNDLCGADPSICGSSDTCTGADNGDGTFVCQCLPVGPAQTTVSMNVTGTIVNQPPSAAAGPDQVIECNGPNTGSFNLDGTGSRDPDGNITEFRWFRGSRVGAKVGFQPKVAIAQAVGTEVSYILRTTDAFGQTDEDTTKARVADTTPPIIACNTPATITPSQAPITFTATATDICDASVIPAITSFVCLKKDGGVQSGSSCVVHIGPQNNMLVIENSGGVDTRIRWQVRATDDANNLTTATCEVLVVNKKSN